MRPHPLCGFSLHSGTIIVSVLQLALSVSLFVFGIVVMQGNGYVDPGANSLKSVAVFIEGWFFIFKGVMGVLMGGLLLLGAKERNLFKCKLWLIASFMMYFVSAMHFIYQICEMEGGLGLTAVLLYIATFLFEGYCVWIVFAFIAITDAYSYDVPFMSS